MPLSYTDLKKGVLFVYENDPYEVLEANFLRMQQRKAVVQTKIRNLITGKVLDRNWQPSDSFEEAEVEKTEANFIYASKGEYWFHTKGNPKERFSLFEEIIGTAGQFLKKDTIVETFSFKGKVIRVKIPIKMDLKVVEAPPSIKGNTAQGGNKVVTLESGAKINAPLFIEEGQVIRVNTETGQYVERAN
ncbi:MAG: elongation factor P [Anaplasmataceae bacterium]|nr:elongation factor P [Anaplasmataceae bacterium]